MTILVGFWQCNVERLSFRKLLRAICMTACDLSACTKPWEIQLEIVKVIYQEFYAEVRVIIFELSTTCQIMQKQRFEVSKVL